MLTVVGSLAWPIAASLLLPKKGSSRQVIASPAATRRAVWPSCRRMVSRLFWILFIFIILIICLSQIQSYRFRHNVHVPSAAASNSVPANKQAMAICISLSVEIPDEPEGEIGVGDKGVCKASPSVGTGWVVTVDMVVLVGCTATAMGIKVSVPCATGADVRTGVEGGVCSPVGVAVSGGTDLEVVAGGSVASRATVADGVKPGGAGVKVSVGVGSAGVEVGEEVGGTGVGGGLSVGVAVPVGVTAGGAWAGTTMICPSSALAGIFIPSIAPSSMWAK